MFYAASGSDLTSLQISGDGTVVQDVTDVAGTWLLYVILCYDYFKYIALIKYSTKIHKVDVFIKI